jgi:seryl-tRNA synthetase
MNRSTALDLDLFREQKGGNPEVVRQSQKARFKDPEDVDRVIAVDKEWREKRFQLDQKKKEVNKIQKEYAVKRKAGEKDENTENQMKDLNKQIEEVEKEEKEIITKLHGMVNKIGNIVHSSVPISQDEANNGIYKVVGTERPYEDWFKHHHELLYMIDGYDPEAGSKTAGHRGYYLKGIAVHLNQALINYSLQFLAKRKYTAVQTPFFMKRDVMDKVAQLEQYDEELYKVTGNKEDGDMYLIATSEQPLCALNLDGVIEGKDLPQRYGGYSTCFRKEAGSYGRDAWGIFRVHQFEKIEQFCITNPDKSWEEHEEMIKTACDFYESFGFCFKVVNIVSGELNNAAAKKYDLEAFFPTLQVYRELVSASNCTDYQSRRLGIVTGTGKDRKFVHMLNATLCATTRTMCCILENYQTEKGINVPAVLQPYLAPFLEDPTFIPFVKAAPKRTEAAKQKPAAKK